MNEHVAIQIAEALDRIAKALEKLVDQNTKSTVAKANKEYFG